MASNIATSLITKLTVSNRLDSDDIQSLQQLPIQERQVPAQHIIVADGSRPKECCLLAEGFAYRAKITQDGKRQVLSLHIPGEIPDLQSLYLNVMDHDFTTLTPCTLGLIPHEAIKALCKQRPNVTGALWRETLIDAAIFREWIVNVGRRSADERMAHLFAEIHRRLRAVGRTSDGDFNFPITQSDLGDCLGLSTVHVNRTLQELRQQGIMQVERPHYRILDHDKLEELAGFDPTYLHLPPAA
ncbi:MULTISPECIES: Crp/Fnr family transcriptional regulator [Bradyrhizobium]|uniref:Crp/Fnr family transcriptional regulator n=1 Tax=Bradyrhizobium TaxID=374 RepID=UPI000841CB43|nr:MULTISPECIES: Crp/Fnr family transcriptional regulator [Bradyrhizobium]MCP1838371.1 CRP-like cAMP-binding protein [Bradyrhizobium sp. USDA 4538]MCP1898935.1 CRP-like cAMP-binding protein [Bradyrhizobium sp. USDA 4537]MCP1909431.1 CRP-like cAMP-binding protein [Bradyrhizobium elkanii]MCP1986951.1 CRP-like cAMP-binding protein [Bradyrhizobium sp. USDA 4539]ODM74079.1 Crp/Fnr family transcriptional regulator [Bradyrhizobium elkanii]